jgi:hypothetical protein
MISSTEERSGVSDPAVDPRRLLARLIVSETASEPDPHVPLSDEAWAALRSTAISERVVPALAGAVADGRLAATAEQAEDAAELWLEMMRRCLRIEGRLLWLTDALARRGVDVRVLKGPASAHLDHARPEDRQFGDLDVLVRSDDLPAVFAVLEADGFRRRFPEPRRGFDQRFTKSVSFAGDVEIDVHRTLAEGPIGHRIPVDDLWRRATPFELGGVEVNALDHPERFVHACLHTHLGRPPARLSSLSDVARGLIGDLVDVREVAEVAARWRVGPVVERAVATAILECWWPADIEAAWIEPTAPGLLDSVLIESHRQVQVSSATRAVLATITIPGFAAKLSYLTALALPERSYVTTRHAGRTQRFRHAVEQFRSAALGAGDRRDGRR